MVTVSSTSLAGAPRRRRERELPDTDSPPAAHGPNSLSGASHVGGGGHARRAPASPRPANVTGANDVIDEGLVKNDVSEARISSQRDRLTKEYATDEIVVEWEPRLCYHSQNCVRSLPQVFDDSRRPWGKVDAAS